MTQLTSHWYGQLPYSEALELQQERAHRAREFNENFVMGLEHPVTVTLGLRAKKSLDLHTPPECLEALGIDLVHICRGGEATLHSPGQLVIYPIINIKKMGLSVRDYMSLLVTSTHQWLKEQGVVTAFSMSQPGLYTEKGKIAFFGIRADRGVTTHGISLNLRNDLELFSHIRPCGKDREKFDRLDQYMPRALSQSLFASWLENFVKELPVSKVKSSSSAEALV